MKRTLLGVITPSSNTVLEPISQAMVNDLENVSMHFGRFRVTQISLNDVARNQFDMQQIIEAAELLSDAQVANIIWSGTASGWLGFERDEKLCSEIEKATGIPASSSVLALNEILKTTGVKKIGLVTPYLDEIQELIIRNYEKAGYECVASENLKDKGNFSFSEVSEETLEKMTRRAALSKPDAIAIYCTNLRGAGIVDRIERETRIPVYDSVTVGVWKGLKMAGVDTKRVTGWGNLFQK